MARKSSSVPVRGNHQDEGRGYEISATGSYVSQTSALMANAASTVTSTFWEGSAGFWAQRNGFEVRSIVQGDGLHQVGRVFEGALQIFGDRIVWENQLLFTRRRRGRGRRGYGRSRSGLVVQQVGVIERRWLRWCCHGWRDSIHEIRFLIVFCFSLSTRIGRSLSS